MCDGFGWVEIKDGLVVAHTLDKDGENNTHKFENEEIVKAVEKAKKYDLLMNANSQVVKDNITMSQYEQENKRLEEQLKTIKGFLGDLEHHSDIIEEKLRKFEVLQYSPKELEIELNRGTNNIVVIQNVEEFVDKQLLHGSHVSDGLLKILKGKA